MQYRDLRDFLDQLESRGLLRRIGAEVSPRLEMTEICDRTLKAGGPALLFERPTGSGMPVLGNLFGTPERERHPLRRAEEIAQHRHRETGRALEQQRRPASLERPVADLGHLELRADFDRDAPQQAARLELVQEVSQVSILHGDGSGWREGHAKSVPLAAPAQASRQTTTGGGSHDPARC